METEINDKVFQQTQHKGGNQINKILNINTREDNTFSFDEYRNAIENERITRQNMLKTDNEEKQRRCKLKLLNNLNDPKNQQLSNRVMTERIKQTLSKNIRKHYNDIYEARQYVNHYNSTGGKPIEKWNINNITFETTENGSNVTRVVIRKQRGNKQNEIIAPVL